jgi:regulatory protein
MPDTITTITPQKKDPHRFNIFLNGEYAFSLSEALARQLNCGDPLPPSDINRLKALDGPDRAFQRALYYLDFRPRSRHEMMGYLSSNAFSHEIVDQTLARLESFGYINDHEFARIWIENRNRLNPKGCYMLRAELRQKGIDDAIIASVLTDIDEAALAWKAVAPRLSRLKHVDKNKFYNKINGFLSRRGFSWDICRNICDQAWENR